MISTTNIDQLQSATVYDQTGDKVGKVGQVYLDDSTGEPTWATVSTGLFGTSESFVPLQGADFDGTDRINVQYSKDQIKDAPRVASDGHLEPAEEDELYRFYGLGSGQTTTDQTTTDQTTTGQFAGTGTDIDRDSDPTDRTRAEGYDTSGPTTDDAMTRSEEQLNVGTQKVQSGRARLRKYVTTEQQQVTVPVSREEVRVEREPITDGNIGNAMDGPAISEEEHEVVLTEERPVVSKEAVPVERVKLGKDTVTEQHTVSEEVRKENIDLDAGAETTTGRQTDRGDRT